MLVGLALVALVLAHPDLDEGRVAMSAMKYRAALPALTRVTADGRATEAEVVEAWGLLARAQQALKNPTAAQGAYEALLRLAPMAEEPAGAPTLRALFQQAKAAVYPAGTVRLVRRPSAADALVVDVVNPWRLPLVAAWRPVPAGASKALPVEGHQVVTALPAGTQGYLELQAEGRVVAALGSRAEPLRGPAVAAAADAPKVETAPRLAPETTPAPLLPPPPPPAVASSRRRTAAWVLVGAGLAATAAGAGVMVWGLDDVRRGEGFPYTVADYEEAERLLASGPTKQLAGGVVGGAGLVAAALGAVLLLTE